MKRKLIKQGMGGVTLSLPIKWVRSRDLKAGDEVEVIERGAELVVGGSGTGIQRKELTIDHTDRGLLRTLIAAHYRAGYQEIELTFTKEMPYGVLEEVVESLIGYELVSLSSTSCLIRDISRDDSESGVMLTNKLFQSIHLLFDTVCEHFLTKDRVKDLKSLRKNILRLRDYTRRRIRQEQKDYSYELYSLVLVLEKIAGDYYHLAVSQINWNATIKEFFLDQHGLLRDLQSCLMGMNYARASRLHAKLLGTTRREWKENSFVELARKIKVNGSVFYLNRIEHNLLTISSRVVFLTSLDKLD